MNHLRTYRVSVITIVLSLAAVVFLLVFAPAASAQTVAQSYTAAGPLQTGMLVRLSDDKKTVDVVGQNSQDKILGVIIQSNDAPLSLSGTSAGQQVYVATSGQYSVLVSNQNGPIQEGDYVSLSAIDGIGMKTEETSLYVVGKAVAAYDGKTGVLSRTTVKDSAGNEQTVAIGGLKVQIDIRRNPLYKGKSTNVPPALQRIADSLAGKPVSPVRVYTGAVIALVSIIAVCSMLYAGVRASIIALGRNPLARRTIFRNLLQVICIGLTILIIGLVGVYLILKL